MAQLPSGAPDSIGGFRVLQATAKECRRQPGCCYGTARIVREDGKQAVIQYNERLGQIYGTNQEHRNFAGMTEWGVNYVAHWCSPSHARRLFKQETVLGS